MLLDLFYFAWPTLQTIVLFPVMLLIGLLDLLTSQLLLQSFVWPGVYVAVSALGLLYGEQTIFSLITRQKKSKQQPRKATWFLVWLLQAIVGGLILQLALEMFAFFAYTNIILLLLGLGSIFFYVFQIAISVGGRFEKLSQQRHWKYIGRSTTLTTLLLALYPFVVVIFGLIWLFVDPVGNPQGSRFFPIHAMAQNRCYLEPERKYCPKNLEEYRLLDVQAYDAKMQNTQVLYQYDETRQQFVLAIRYSPTRAVVFDRRFIELDGLDFQEFSVNPLTNRLQKTPDFLKLSPFPDWVYQP